MLHVICATLVVMAALAETTVLQRWIQQYDLPVIQRAATGATFQPAGQGRNLPSPRSRENLK